MAGSPGRFDRRTRRSLAAVLPQLPQVSAVSPKYNTTRRRVLGISTKDDLQIVYADTPGFVDPKYVLVALFAGGVVW